MIVRDAEQLTDTIDLTIPPTIDLSTTQLIIAHRETLSPFRSRSEIKKLGCIKVQFILLIVFMLRYHSFRLRSTLVRKALRTKRLK